MAGQGKRTQSKQRSRKGASKPAPRPAAQGDATTRLALVVIALCAGLVVANNSGLLPARLAGRLTLGPREVAVKPAAPAAAKPRPPRPKPQPDEVAELPHSEPPPDLPPEPVSEPEPPRSRPEPRPKRPAPRPAPVQAVRPPRVSEAPPPLPEQAPAPPRKPGLLSPDERRERLVVVDPPPGFTTEWTGGPAILKTAANEVERGWSTHRRVALTFDGCWEDQEVPALLEVLRGQQLRATFFLTGTFAERYPETVRRIAAAGHEIGSHSYDHPALTKLGDAAVLAQMEKTERLLLKLGGAAYRPYLRPPFGDRDPRVLRLLIRHGFLPVYWTVDTLDWRKEATPDAVLTRVKEKGLTPGAIYLMHAGSAATARALPRLVTLVRAADLQPGPLRGVLQR